MPQARWVKKDKPAQIRGVTRRPRLDALSVFVSQGRVAGAKAFKPRMYGDLGHCQDAESPPLTKDCGYHDAF